MACYRVFRVGVLFECALCEKDTTDKKHGVSSSPGAAETCLLTKSITTVADMPAVGLRCEE